MRALIDCRATGNFILEEFAEWLKIDLQQKSELYNLNMIDGTPLEGGIVQ